MGPHFAHLGTHTSPGHSEAGCANPVRCGLFGYRAEILFLRHPFLHLEHRVDAGVIFVPETGDRTYFQEFNAPISRQHGVVDMHRDYSTDDDIMVRSWVVAWKTQDLMQSAFELHR